MCSLVCINRLTELVIKAVSWKNLETWFWFITTHFILQRLLLALAWEPRYPESWLTNSPSSWWGGHCTGWNRPSLVCPPPLLVLRHYHVDLTGEAVDTMCCKTFSHTFLQGSALYETLVLCISETSQLSKCPRR